MLLLFNAPPLERGLDEYRYEDGSLTYRFPPDYEDRLRIIREGHMEELLEKLGSEGRL